MQRMQEVLKKSLVKIKRLEAELQQAKSNTSAPKEPIAIVGLGARFPGSISNLEELWQALIEKKNMAQPIPLSRWDHSKIYDKDPLTPGKTHAKEAMFLDNDVRAFDAGFFSIVPREAKSIDPLQRMILEVVYEALENANIPSKSLRGTNTAVYIALGNSDYIQARLRSGHLETVDVYDTTGIPFATASGRVSYLYDLQGSSFALDAACSSSIVGMHLASEALNQGEADTAIVASANLILTPELFVGLSKLGSLSANRECRAFDNDAEGYVRGEGCGVVILKRKSDALQAKNNIHAYILGSAVKHDGLSNGFTAPNPEVQVATVQAAIKNAGISVNDVYFVEAHGIGNKFTDTMEINAIANGYKGVEHPIYVGSLKPNLGHSEAAVGMAMLYKVIATLKNKAVAPNLYFEHPNDDIPWQKIPVQVPTEAIELNTNGQPLRAAINLSGYSGTNVHIIFEEAEAVESVSTDTNDEQVLLWSAKSQPALKALAQKYLDNWGEISQNSFDAFAYTLQNGRDHWGVRLSVIASNSEDAKKGLEAFIHESTDYPYQFTEEVNTNQDVVFLFTGQGAQYYGMGKEIYDTQTVFKKAIDDCAKIADTLLETPIKDVLWNHTDTDLINQTAYTQPALFVIEYAFAQLWMSRGIQPAAVVGHSIGEFVALTIAGAIRLEDAIKLVIERGHLMQSLPVGEGAMAAVMADEEKVRFYTDQTKGYVDIAAINTPKTVTISGDAKAVEYLIQAMKEVKIRSIPLKVSHAFHSHLMDSILEDFEKVVAKVQFFEPQIPVISNETGQELSLEEMTPQYFSGHLRNAVRFVDDIQYLSDELGIQTYLECGPSDTLINLAKKIISDKENTFISSAKKDKDALHIQLQAIQALYHTSIDIDWQKLTVDKKLRGISLPTYAWQKEVYWENPVRGVGEAANRTSDIATSSTTQTDTTISNGRPLTPTKANIMALMQKEAAETLGLSPGQKLDVSKSLREQGFDSMMSGEFLSKMEKYFDTKLDMSLIHIYGTLKELQVFFVEEYLGGGEIDDAENELSMGDILFNSDLTGDVQTDVADWHKIKDTDPKWLQMFKKFDKMISTPKN
ncbi:MAG: type I polyketide synthase [Chitinophagales bacterium]|nr:type I polyketide synthase [Chitinophagales bacterium]